MTISSYWSQRSQHAQDDEVLVEKEKCLLPSAVGRVGKRMQRDEMTEKTAWNGQG